MGTYLVAGGAGYIGGVCVEKLIELGDQVVIVDNLKTGHKSNIHPKAKFYQGDVGNSELIDRVFQENKIETVLDFAGLIQVGESVKEPSKYFQNNLVQGISLLDSMIKNGCQKIIFSSTAAVYGNPVSIPIKEEDLKEPINPYGESKYMFEKVIHRYHEAYGLKYTIFRYFNACGATKLSREDHTPESHLIPLIFQTINGKREVMKIFGDDYDTPDGTCIRDYVHVSDLIDAHLQAIKFMETVSTASFNLGNGNGYSVKEVIAAAEKVSGKKVHVEISDRRPGDPARLVASSDRARNDLKWSPKYAELEAIIQTAWEAEINPPPAKTN